MPRFRGIEQKQVVDSLQNAAQFVLDQKVGPECDAIAQKWLGGENIARLEAATSDAELVNAVRDTNAAGAFTMLQKLLVHHALADTDGKGLEIAQDLSRWGGLSGARAFALFPSDMEIDAHIAQNPTLQAHAGDKLELETPLATYGVVLTEADATNKDALEQRFNDALQPLRARMEVTYHGQGMVGSREGRKSGFMFEGTREAAQAIANAFPDHEVLNEQDERVTAEGKHSQRARASQEKASQIAM